MAAQFNDMKNSPLRNYFIHSLTASKTLESNRGEFEQQEAFTHSYGRTQTSGQVF